MIYSTSQRLALITPNSKSRIVNNLVFMLKQFSKVNFRSFTTKYLSQISKVLNLPTERQKYSAEMPKYITPEEVCKKYKIGEQLSISIRPIVAIYYDRGIVILKRDRRADIFILEPEMFHILVPSDFKYCLEKKWICFKAEDGNKLENHMNAFYDAARTLFYNDGGSMKHLNRWFKRLAKQRKKRLESRRLALT